MVAGPNNDNNGATTLSNVVESKTSSKSSTQTSSRPPTTKSTTENQNEILKNEILKSLTDDDFVMETPSAALFTLIFGKYCTT